MKEKLKQSLFELFDSTEITYKNGVITGKEAKLFFMDKKGIPFFTLELYSGINNSISCEIDVSVREVYTKLLGLTGNKKYLLKEKQIIYLWGIFIECFNESFSKKLGFKLPKQSSKFKEIDSEREIPSWIKDRITPYKENVDFSESNEISFQKIRKIYNPKVVTTLKW